MWKLEENVSSEGLAQGLHHTYQPRLAEAAEQLFNLLIDIKNTSGQYLCILVFTKSSIFNIKKAGNVFQKHTVHLLTLHVQALLILQSALQAQALKYLRDILYLAFSLLLCFLQPQSSHKQKQKDRSALSETRKKQELRKHGKQN